MNEIMQPMNLWTGAIFLSLSSFHCQLTGGSSFQCSKSELLCGENTCYDPTTQKCIKTKTVRCISKCRDRCYNPTLQQCLNEMVCGVGEQRCYVKYTAYGFLQYFPKDQCYNPLSAVCLDNSLCAYPSGVCNQQCLKFHQVCVENRTICESSFASNSTKICHGSCYNSMTQQCVNGAIQCIDSNCSGECYNSSTQQCLNGTICPIGEQLCTVEYDTLESAFSVWGDLCYDPTKLVCLNNSLCHYPSRICNQQCLKYNQVCVDNTTICSVPRQYNEYLPDQIKLCNGKCYDSTIEQCIAGTVHCISGNCSGQCYNSSQQCLNETLCNINEAVCDRRYGENRFQCYNPSTQACLENWICDYPSQSCNGRCLSSNQICVDNVTICSMTNYHEDYQANQIKLCNGACYNSTTQQCVDEYTVRCIAEPFQQNCTWSSGEHQSPIVSLISILMIICVILNFYSMN